METEAAATAVQTAGFIHPVMADVMTILSFVLVMASVGIAAIATHYAWRQTGGTVDVIEGHVSWLRTEAERLATEIQASVTKDSQTAEELAALKEQVEKLAKTAAPTKVVLKTDGLKLKTDKTDAPPADDALDRIKEQHGAQRSWAY